MKGRQPATVQARLFYQAIPPYYLQDRFCTAPEKPDTSRLFFLTGHLDLSGTRAESWKLLVVSSGPVAVPLHAGQTTHPEPSTPRGLRTRAAGVW